MKVYVRMVIITLLSFLIYLPVMTSDNYMSIGIMDALHFYFSVGAGFVLIVLTIRDERKVGRSILLISLGILLILSPRLVDKSYQWREEYKRIHQNFTPESLRQKHYNGPEGFSPPMKNVKVDFKEGHVYLEMEFDSEQPGRRVKAKYTSDGEFLKEMMYLLDSLISSETDFAQLKQISIRVKYNDKIYTFENIPLKDTKGRPIDRSDEWESFVPLLKEKMKVIHSAE